jgi:mRNA-degrading endonuclease toxin of MazEF toxin-antitoxin module
MGLGEDPENDILICVDNRSTGQGVQCVRCQGDKPCTVLRQTPPKKPGITAVEGVLTEAIQPPDTSALEDRIRTLEDRVKALEAKKQ